MARLLFRRIRRRATAQPVQAIRFSYYNKLRSRFQQFQQVLIDKACKRTPVPVLL
jgi:hypothetical protein